MFLKAVDEGGREFLVHSVFLSYQDKPVGKYNSYIFIILNDVLCMIHVL